MTPAARPSAVRSRSRTRACSISSDAGVREDRGDQGAADLGAGGVAAGVHDAVAVVAALAGQRQLAGGVAVEAGTERDQLAQPGGALLAEHPHGVGVAQADAGLEGVVLVLERGVVGAERGGDAALRPAGGAVVDADLGDDQDPSGCGRRAARRSARRRRSRRRRRLR